jgi:hypothetical protein
MKITMKRGTMRQRKTGKLFMETEVIKALSIQKTANLKGKQTFNFKDIEPFCDNFQGLPHNPPVRSTKNDPFILFVEYLKQ